MLWPVYVGLHVVCYERLNCVIVMGCKHLHAVFSIVTLIVFWLLYTEFRIHISITMLRLCLLLWNICLHIPHKSPSWQGLTAQTADDGFIVRAPGLTSNIQPCYKVTTARIRELDSFFAILQTRLKIASLLCAHLSLSGGYCHCLLRRADPEDRCITFPQNITPQKITVRTLYCFS